MKPQDVIVALKLAADGGRDVPYASIASDLGMSASEVHAAVRRLSDAKLVDPEGKRVHAAALRNFLVHGVPYVFPVRPKEVTRGLPTGWAAPAFANIFQSGDQLPPVWPDPEGSVRGVAVNPLYPSVPQAARKDLRIYSLLAIVDVLRLGRARERAEAQRQLEQLIPSHA
jgi:DNA-binding Lrp family transcriptional regulator